MKRFIFLASLFAVMLLAADLPAQKYGYITDTVSTSSSTFAAYHYLGGTSASNCEYFDRQGALEVSMKSDSLSGGTNAYAYVQAAYEETPSEWFTVGTLYLNGVTATGTYTTESTPGLRYRIYLYAASTTQSTRFRAGWTFKADRRRS